VLAHVECEQNKRMDVIVVYDWSIMYVNNLTYMCPKFLLPNLLIGEFIIT